MRIFVLGVGATGSYLVKLLTRQGHHVTCGDRDPERARYFLGAKLPVPVERVNARDVWNIVKAARGAQLLVNACPPMLNRIVLRAALRLRAHYLDLASHYTGHPFRAEQVEFASRFEEKRRAAVITAGVAPGLTNLLIAAGADLLDTVESVRVRLYESTDTDAPFSQGRRRHPSMKPLHARVCMWIGASASAGTSATGNCSGFLPPSVRSALSSPRRTK
ncbi:MAG: saccharopine dehydrogenase NADP-binding domain-containing protein [Nitrospira sp.]|nr:saccharopine dehydrogenase NADP-binding domain-containing protein [Nitrospira sp.]